MGADKAGAKKSMAEANAEFKKGNYAVALKHYDKAVELDPGEVTYPANRANVHLRMKSWQEAENDSTAALTINPKYAKAFDRRGQARLQLKKHKEALEDFEEAKKIDPKTANVDKNIEEAKKRMGETGAGKEDKAGAKKAMGEANAEFKKGNYEGALTHYTKAMELDPGEDMYPANRANVYLKLNKWAEAEKDCTDAVKLDPKASKAFDRRGQARMQLQKYKEALEDFEEAKKLEPKTANVDTNIEKANEKLKEQEKEKEKNSENDEKGENTVEGNGEKEESRVEETKEKESFTKSDAELLQDIEAELERRMNNKEKKFAEKELEVERDELEKERKMLIEEKLKFEEIMKEFFEEESKREEEEDSDSDSDSDENKNNNNDNTNEQKSHSTARSRRHSSQFDLQEEEKVPVRSTRWHPQVGKAPAPNLTLIRSEIDNKNTKYQPKSARRVEIFNDKDYMKKIKEAKRLGAERSARQPRTPRQILTPRDGGRPRSLVEQDDDGRSRIQQRGRSHHQNNHQHQDRPDPLGDDRQMVEDARKAVVKERLELELLRRQLERKKREAEYASGDTPVTIDPFRDEELYKPKKQIYKTQFELDFENKWREKFGESYHGGL